MSRHFQQLPPTRIAFEVGSHSRWMSELLIKWGHEVILANPRNLRLISDSIRKSDRVDAHTLARLARIDPKLLSPIEHSSPATYSHMTLLKGRDSFANTQMETTNVAPIGTPTTIREGFISSRTAIERCPTSNCSTLFSLIGKCDALPHESSISYTSQCEDEARLLRFSTACRMRSPTRSEIHPAHFLEWIAEPRTPPRFAR